MLDIDKQAVFKSGVTIAPDIIQKHNNSNSYYIKKGLTVLYNSVNINEDIHLILPDIIYNEIGLELKIVNLNNNFNIELSVYNINKDLINKKYSKINIKPLSSLSITSISENDWWIF